MFTQICCSRVRRSRCVRVESKGSPHPSIGVTVLGYDPKDGVCLLWVNKDKPEKNISLLLVTEEGKSHYCWIKDFSKLLSSQTNARIGAREYCLNCLCSFFMSNALAEYQERCLENECVKTAFLPQEQVIKFKGDEIKFSNHKKQMRVPFMITADFESSTTPID